jgi:hypothetical protein
VEFSGVPAEYQQQCLKKEAASEQGTRNLLVDFNNGRLGNLLRDAVRPGGVRLLHIVPFNER